MGGAGNGFVCVTGASGFTGSTAVDFLLLNGYSVLATDHPRCDFQAVREHREFMAANPELYGDVSLELAPADLKRTEDLVTLFRGRDVRYLFHPAAVFSLSAPPELLRAVNVDGTRNLLEAAAAHAPNLLGTAVWSTAMVYAEPKRPGTISEDDPLEPNNYYAESKLAEEKVALEFCAGGMPLVILRTASVYGPRNKYGMARALKTMAWSTLFSPMPVPAGGKRLLHFAHIDDVVAAALHLVYVMGHRKISGRAFNVADDTPMTTVDAMRMAAHLLRVRPPKFDLPEKAFHFLGSVLPYGGKVPFFDLEREDIPYILRNKMFDNTQLKKTGYLLKYPETRTGLAVTFDWYARNGRLEQVWYRTHPGWRRYWSRLRPEDRPFADYKLVASEARRAY